MSSSVMVARTLFSPSINLQHAVGSNCSNKFGTLSHGILGTVGQGWLFYFAQHAGTFRHTHTHTPCCSCCLQPFWFKTFRSLQSSKTKAIYEHRLSMGLLNVGGGEGGWSHLRPSYGPKTHSPTHPPEAGALRNGLDSYRT